jgi:hypothetical protein
MSEQVEDVVLIRRQWNSQNIARIKLADLGDFHWSSTSGGVMAPAPRPFIHAYCSCEDVEGEISHSCRHGIGPHSIKVCLVKRDNDKEVWEKVRAKAGPQPESMAKLNYAFREAKEAEEAGKKKAAKKAGKK